jgi:hypothetical protein
MEAEVEAAEDVEEGDLDQNIHPKESVVRAYLSILILLRKTMTLCRNPLKIQSCLRPNH